MVMAAEVSDLEIATQDPLQVLGRSEIEASAAM
jgi:hypothetical protein